MATTTITRSRSSSIDSKHGTTFVHFSTPQRTLSMTSETSQRWREQMDGSSRPGTATSLRAEETQAEEEQVLPYRPVKSQLVQLHVTTSVTSVASLPTSRRPSFSNTARPNLQARPRRSSESAVRPDLDDTAKVLIDDTAKVLMDDKDKAKVLLPVPSRSASLRKNDKPKDKTWPNNIRPPPPSPGGSYRFQAPPTLVRTPWEIERGRPGSRWSRASKKPNTFPARVFKELPREIYQCILDHVENVHSQGSLLDVVSSRADLRALSLVDRKWNRVAQDALYHELWLPSNKAVGKRKFLRQPKKSKLKLLLHTLCTCPPIAFLVYNMHITAGLAEEIQAEANGASYKESVLEAVNLTIRQCYNLERVTGYIPETTATNFSLFKALATRTRLLEQAWYLDSSKVLPNLGVFVNCHDEWKNLESLVIAADTDVDLGKVAVSAVLGRLPSLKRLMLSGLHSDDFHNGSLLALPTLRSLRLEKLVGVTDQGIQQLAHSRLAPSLERLSLVGLELTSLETVQTVLLHLTGLRSFVFVQDASPEPQVGVGGVKKFNILASMSLQYFHWDCLAPGTAVSRFAEAIDANHFPRLRKVKVPCDLNGDIQLLCRPIPRIKLSYQDINYLLNHASGRYERNLRVSQIQAQLRIRESRRPPSFSLVAQKDSIEAQLRRAIGSSIGKMESKVEYCLSAEVEGKALADFGAIQRPRRSGRERCERRVDVMALF